MQKIIGVVCLIVGVLLIVWGRDVSQAVGSQLERALTGSVPDKAIWLYVGGSVLGLIGLMLVFVKK
jgi:hypothetical protein